MNDEAIPLVSVIIPTYNHGRYLGRAIQSVLDQTYTNWEMIIIDNHSADNTDEVVKGFSNPLIKYLKIHNNGIIAASRNAGIRAAKGAWIAFLDSDDWWTSDKLTACMNWNDDNVDLIYHDLKIMSEKPSLFGNKKIKSWQVKKPVLTDLLVRGNAIATSSVLVRASIIKSLSGMSECPKLIAAEDYNTWLRIAKKSNKFKYLPEELGYYQMSSNGASAQKDMSIPTSYAAVEFLESVNLSQRNSFNGYLLYTRGRYNYRIAQYDKADKDFGNVIKKGPRKLVIKAFFMIVLIRLFKIRNFLFEN